MIPILVLKTENKVIYNKSNLNCKTFFEEFRLRGYLCSFPFTEHPQSDGHFHGLFHIISTPFLRNCSQLTPYLENIMLGDPNSHSFLSFSSGSGNMYVFYHYPRGRYRKYTIYNNKGPTPISWEAIEGSGNTCTYKSYLPPPPFLLNFSRSFWKIPYISVD